MEIKTKTMTPREKAIQLIDVVLSTEINIQYTDSQDGQCIHTGYMSFYSAVKIASHINNLLYRFNNWQYFINVQDELFKITHKEFLEEIETEMQKSMKEISKL